jgi:hypothetical protein
MINAIAGTITTSRNQYGERVTAWASRAPNGETIWLEHVERHDHACVGGTMGSDGYWVYDYQGIELAKVCDRCKREKLARFRPEIIEGYGQQDVDEPINGE